MHAQVANYVPRFNSDWINHWWKITRVMLAAGWKYKASGDTNVKESAGVSTDDRWAIGGITNHVQVGAQGGTSPIITTGANGVITLTGVSGFVAASVGRYIRLTGFGDANDGVFRILSQGGTTITYFNPNCPGSVTGGTSQTWSERQGGAVASVGLSGDPPSTPGRQNITGLTGMVLATPFARGSTGNRLTISGAATGANNGTFMITRVLSATSVEVDNAAGVVDANNGAIIWSEVDPLQQVFPVGTIGSALAGHWICMQGPSTIKVPIGTGVPTGTFRKGENVTQATSLAEGEVIGVQVDTGGGLGYLVIMPRLNGVGAGVRGWSNSAVITGAISGATATPTATLLEYVRESVFVKGIANTSGYQGHWFQQCVESVGESAQRFSVLATAGAVTASLAPGLPTGTFPSLGSWAVCGTGGSNSATTGMVSWYDVNNGTTNLGVIQLMCANCIGTAGTSEDGSWFICPGVAANQYNGWFGFQFCENSEDGDVDPYVTNGQSNFTSYAGTRTVATTLHGLFRSNWYEQFAAASTPWRGYRRRGMSSGDAFQEFGCAMLGNASSNVGAYTPNSQERVACVPNPALTVVKDQLWVISTQSGSKMRKGSLRWMVSIAFVTPGALYDNGRFVGIGQGLYANAFSGFAVGPWDGVTPGGYS